MRIDARSLPPEDVDLATVVGHLRAGGLLAYPTETVYGFGCLVRDEPVARLRSLKREASDRPFLLLVGGTEGLEKLAWSDDARELARIFWPGALTLVLADPHGVFPPLAHGEGGTVAVRWSSHSLASRLVEAVGEPLTSTSANVPGGEPALSGDEAMAAAVSLGLGPDVALLDGGTLPSSRCSTIVDCTGAHPVVVRVGATPVARLRCLLPEIHGATRD